MLYRRVYQMIWRMIKQCTPDWDGIWKKRFYPWDYETRASSILISVSQYRYVPFVKARPRSKVSLSSFIASQPRVILLTVFVLKMPAILFKIHVSKKWCACYNIVDISVFHRPPRRTEFDVFRVSVWTLGR